MSFNTNDPQKQVIFLVDEWKITKNYRYKKIDPCYLIFKLSSLVAQCALVNWISFGSCNRMPSVWRQAITWTSADLLAIWSTGTHFSEIRIRTQHFSLMKMQSKMSFVKRRPFSPGGWVKRRYPIWIYRASIRSTLYLYVSRTLSDHQQTKLNSIKKLPRDNR